MPLGKQLIKSRGVTPLAPLHGLSAPHVFWWGFGWLPLTGTASGRKLSKLYLYWVNSLPGIFISYCCCNHNKLWLNVRKNVFSYSSRGLKSEMGLTGLKSRCWQGCLSLEALGENPFPHTFTSFKELPVFLGSRLPSRMASFWPLLFSYLLSIWLASFSLIRTHVITLDLPEYSRTISLSQNP